MVTPGKCACVPVFTKVHQLIVLTQRMECSTGPSSSISSLPLFLFTVIRFYLFPEACDCSLDYLVITVLTHAFAKSSLDVLVAIVPGVSWEMHFESEIPVSLSPHFAQPHPPSV